MATGQNRIETQNRNLRRQKQPLTLPVVVDMLAIADVTVT